MDSSGLNRVNKVCHCCSGNEGVGIGNQKRCYTGPYQKRTKYRYIKSRRVVIVRKLDVAKVEWILVEKRKGTKNQIIADSMGNTVRWVQKICARYGNLNQITYPLQ